MASFPKSFVLPTCKALPLSSMQHITEIRSMLKKWATKRNYEALYDLNKFGHTGTLDPQASGVLPVAINHATKLMPFIGDEKQYKARIRLGMQTNTNDADGSVISENPCAWLTRDAIEESLSTFVGKTEQNPPAFSALRMNGKRLYELARNNMLTDYDHGKKRTVTIHSIDVFGWHPCNNGFPEVQATIDCASGTYIRSIARDLGQILKDKEGNPVGGMLVGLHRTKSNFVEDSGCWTTKQLFNALSTPTNETLPVLSSDWMLQHLPLISLPLASNKMSRLINGQPCFINKPKIIQSQYVQNVETDKEKTQSGLYRLYTTLQNNQNSISPLSDVFHVKSPSDRPPNSVFFGIAQFDSIKSNQESSKQISVRLKVFIHE